jgi:hypothetical protein
MPRKHNRTTERGSYGSDRLKEALRDLQVGCSLKATSKKYGIPRTTLRRHGKRPVRHPGTVKLGRWETTMEVEFEQKLVEYVKSLDADMTGLTPRL